MYKSIIRPLLFLLPPELIHKLTFTIFNFFFKIPFIPILLKKYFHVKSENLRTQISGIIFENKVGIAAGLDKNAECFRELSSFGFSHIEIGTVTPKAQFGNPKPRLFRLVKDNALINRMGLNNKGVQHVSEKIKSLRKGNLIIGGNIGKNNDTLNKNAADDYLYCFQILYDKVDYFTVNVSCPNVSDLSKLQDHDSLRLILEGIASDRKNKTKYKPVFLKIAPDLTFKQIDEVLDLCSELGIDGIVATNTTNQRYNLTYSEESIRKIGNGGLSGKPLKDRSTEVIRYIHSRTGGKLPIIGVGGIMTPEDALEKIKAGAWLLQIYTGFIYNGPSLALKINKAIDRYLKNTEPTKE
jgi:dihydroorotate dehydrogenase